MNVLEGECFEQCCILYEGCLEWMIVDGEELVLMDGCWVVEFEVNYLLLCNFIKIFCIYLNFELR